MTLIIMFTGKIVADYFVLIDLTNKVIGSALESIKY